MSPEAYAENARRAVRVVEPAAPDDLWIVIYKLPYEVGHRRFRCFTEDAARRRARILRAGHAAMLAEMDK